ncbi:MAG: diaminopimelate decarboxylase [Bacteroidota bacterium]
MEEFSYREHKLYCERLPVTKLGKDYGTPLYTYSKNSIISHCRNIEKSFGSVPHLTSYAVKANANREILAIIANEGIGADIGSAGELSLALAAGFPASLITYSGVGKRRDEIDMAIHHDILAFNVESEEEIRVISAIASQQNRTVNIFLRVNLDIETDTHPYITTGRKYNKFGIDSTRIGEIMKTACSIPSIKILGIHIHIGSQIIQRETFVKAAHEVSKLVHDLKGSGMPVDQLNFGGGFGVTYRDYVEHPALISDGEHSESHVTVSNFIGAIVPILQKTGCKILIQPGRSIMAHSGILLSEILYIKHNSGKTFIIIDAGMNDFMRPTLYQSFHQIVPTQIREGVPMVADVVGPLCESGDFFALERKVPHVEVGDYLAVMCTGAYGFVLASNYNGRPRPAEVLVSGESSKIIRERETIEEL